MNLPTGTITFLFTDIEGSTQMWEMHPDEMRPALARHEALLRSAIDANNGYVVKSTGDGLMAAFHTATDGLNAALLAQQGLQTEHWPDPVVIKVRMGLHTGAAELRDGDYFGQALNRAARLMAAGHGGQVLLTDATQELCRDSVATPVSMLNLGERRLRDLTRPETIHQLQHPDLENRFPPLRTLDNPDFPNNLPQQVTSFIGRAKEMAAVTALLGKTRLLTLTGAEGSGKSRLSLQVAADVLDEYPDGVWLVELAPVSDPSAVPQAVAHILGVKEQPGQTVPQALAESLKTRRLLLVMDNTEHVLTASAALVANLLRSCQDVKVLATSREPLGIAGELTYRIPSLSLPDPKNANAPTAQSLSQFEAVRLFIDRAAFVKPDFAVTNQNAPALAELCFRLDGIPLALELAAARIRSLSVEEINQRLDSRFRLLTGGDRSALPRQQTLRALVDWSYDLLDEPEKRLLSRLSAFSGGWTLAAAEAVCGFDPIADWEAMDLLTSLVDKSLVLAEEQGNANRYRMLETLRQYALEKRESFGEAETLGRRHRDWFLALAEAAEPKLMGPEQAEWLTGLEAEHDNLRLALDWCAEEVADGAGSEAGLRLAGALWRFWNVRGYFAEGRKHLTRALGERDGRTAVSSATSTAKVLHGLGSAAHEQGDYVVARAHYEESLAIRRRLEDRRGVADSLSDLGLLSTHEGDYSAARSLYDESLSIRRDLGDKRGIAITLGNLGIVAHEQSDYEQGRRLYEESLAIRRELGDKRGISMSLNNLGSIAGDQDDFVAAKALHEESLAIKRELGDRQGIAHSLNNLGGIAYAQGDYPSGRLLYEESLSIRRELGDRRGVANSLENLAEVSLSELEMPNAIVLLGAAATLRENLGAPLSPSQQVKLNQELDHARDVLGEAAFVEAWNKGRGMSWKQAVEYAVNTQM